MIEFDAIIVPGRGFKDGKLPPSSESTVVRAIQIYQQGKCNTVIFSGKYSYLVEDNPPLKTEAAMMAEYAIKFNIPSSAILLEEDSQTTVENFYFVKKNILIPNGWTRIYAVGIFPHTKRMQLNAEYVLGPEYQLTTVATDFRFPSNIQKKVEAEEDTKYQIAKHFFKGMEKGDHEAIYQKALADRQK
jgi:uncharacterized SAM-binding protein YcdF (DUF218 family)